MFVLTEMSSPDDLLGAETPTWSTPGLHPAGMKLLVWTVMVNLVGGLVLQTQLGNVSVSGVTSCARGVVPPACTV